MNLIPPTIPFISLHHPGNLSLITTKNIDSGARSRKMNTEYRHVLDRRFLRGFGTARFQCWANKETIKERSITFLHLSFCHLYRLYTGVEYPMSISFKDLKNKRYLESTKGFVESLLNIEFLKDSNSAHCPFHDDRTNSFRMYTARIYFNIRKSYFF